MGIEARERERETFTSVNLGRRKFVRDYKYVVEGDSVEKDERNTHITWAESVFVRKNSKRHAARGLGCVRSIA